MDAILKEKAVWALPFLEESEIIVACFKFLLIHFVLFGRLVNVCTKINCL